jgi:hypothetical protein
VPETNDNALDARLRAAMRRTPSLDLDATDDDERAVQEAFAAAVGPAGKRQEADALELFSRENIDE